MVRLGYACINTALRADNVYTGRTLRLATLKEKGIYLYFDVLFTYILQEWNMLSN